MSFLRRCIGLLAAMVGGAGTALAVLGVLHTWRLHERSNTEVPRAIDQVETLVQSVRQQGEATNALMGTTRVHLTSIRGPITQLAAQEQLNNTTILQTFDEQVLRQLESIEHFSLSMQNSIRGMSSALLLLDSMPFLRGGGKRGSSEAGQWKLAATSLNDTANLLDQVSGTLASIRSGRNVSPQQVRQLAETLNRIEGRLVEVQTHIAKFNEVIDRSSNQLGRLEVRVPKWLDRTAVILTVFFVCFGFSQLSLIWTGLRAAVGGRKAIET